MLPRKRVIGNRKHAQRSSSDRKLTTFSQSKPIIVPSKRDQGTDRSPSHKTPADGRTAQGKRKSKQQLGSVKVSSWLELLCSKAESKGEYTSVLQLDKSQPWYSLSSASSDALTVSDAGQESRLSSGDFDKLSRAIDVLYSKELKLHTDAMKGSLENKSEMKWINDMIQGGTMSDKVAAMTLKVQSSPFHELDMLESLINVAGKKEQRASQLALEALKDLFINNLLPDRPLSCWDVSAFVCKDSTPQICLLLWFEAQVRSRYLRVLDLLDTGLKSNIDYFKRECLQMVSELLIAKPEQEGKLLEMLVNKLGDPSRPTCSKAIEALKTVMRAHPAMRMVVVREVRQFLYRPNLKIRPIFNGIVLLSQVTLSRDDAPLALQLVEGYLSLFDKTVKEEEYGSRLLSALLTGINRALPYLQSTASLHRYVDPLFRIAHTSTSFTTATQALMLLSHLAILSLSKSSSDASDQLSRRYYRALYAKLLSDQITARSKNTAFLNLLYRSIKNDTLMHRAMAFVKRLLICAAQSTAPIAAGLLYLISEIIRDKPALKCMFERVDEEPLREDSAGSFMGNFNCSKREPEFAYEEDATMTSWELSLLKHHYHPSVQAFASSLLEAPQHSISFKGDPTVEFGPMAFLNRFAYKNPKRTVSEKIQRRVAVQSEDPVNLAMEGAAEEDVAPDKRFFFKYFTDKQQLIAEGKSRRKGKDPQLESESPDDEEAEMDRFADKLAEDLINSANSNIEDDLEFSEDDGDDESDGDDASDDDSGEDQNEASDYLDGGVHDEFNDPLEDSSDDDMNMDWDEGIHQVDGDDGDSTAVHLHDATSKATDKGRKKKKDRSSSEDFASAEQYEQLMEDIVRRYRRDEERREEQGGGAVVDHSADPPRKRARKQSKLSK